MGAETKIQWCDYTFNPWEGCTKVSPGCAHCYAETRNARFGGGKAPNWGPGAPRRRTSLHNWNEPRRWNRDAQYFRLIRGEVWKSTSSTMFVGKPETLVHHAEANGRKHDFTGVEWETAARWRPRVFCASLADWLDDEVPVQWLADLLALIHETPHLDWLLLTKRPENWLARMGDACARLTFRCEDVSWLYAWRDGHAPANVWIGTTVEDQKRADERVPHLLRIPSRVRFLSCEPMLGPIDLAIGNPKHRTAESYHSEIHWVIIGGESGAEARDFQTEHAWDLVLQCRRAGVAPFVKQLGRNPVTSNVNAMEWPDSTVFLYGTEQRAADARIVLQDKKGGDLAEWPEELRVREFPK